jgi:hypothetical protein
MQQTLAGDVQQIRTDLLARNPTAVADDGYQLAQEAIADQSPQPPACAPVLRHAWRQMVLWYGLAGLAFYITKARPDLRAHDYALGDRDIKRAEHWSNVAAEQMSAGGRTPLCRPPTAANPAARTRPVPRRPAARAPGTRKF